MNILRVFGANAVRVLWRVSHYVPCFLPVLVGDGVVEEEIADWAHEDHLRGLPAVRLAFKIFVYCHLPGFEVVPSRNDALGGVAIFAARRCGYTSFPAAPALAHLCSDRGIDVEVRRDCLWWCKFDHGGIT